MLGFAPSYRDAAAGTFVIHPTTHLHGALMATWVLLFIAQTGLAASGSLARHRTLGLAGLGIAPLAWASMVVAARRPLVGEPLPLPPFLYDVLLIELLGIVLFASFVVWALAARRTPAIHKRVMVFTLAVPLQAAVDRIRWLPDLGLPRHWGTDVYIYILVLPLVIFDLVSLGRVHRATLRCLAALFAGHVVVNVLWGAPAWRDVAAAVVTAMR